MDLVRGLDPRTLGPGDLRPEPDRIHYKAELPAGQPKYILGSRMWASPIAVARLIRTLRTFRPHILHTYMNDANLWGRLAVRLAWSPVTARDHLGAPRRHVRRLPLAGAAARPMGGLDSSRIRAASKVPGHRLGVPAERVTVIANGVDEQQFRPPTDDQRRAARQARGLADGQLVALMPARISPQKNHDSSSAPGPAEGSGSLAGIVSVAAGRPSLVARRTQGR